MIEAYGQILRIHGYPIKLRHMHSLIYPKLHVHS